MSYKQLEQIHSSRSLNYLLRDDINPPEAPARIYASEHAADTISTNKLDTFLNISKLPKFDKYIFLKVHKAGSSTGQNIFLRYGVSHNLTFLLSRVRRGQYNNVISTTTTLNDMNTQPPPPNKTFDILCCHVNYNKEAFEHYIKGNVAYIGIVREPFDHFYSSLNYFRPGHIFKNIKAVDPVLKYLQNPWKYEEGLAVQYSFTNNRMALEFDFPRSLFKNYSEDESMKYLQKLNAEFELVIVMDYFLESVVLMRRLLNWTTKDIIYLKKNSGEKHPSVNSTYKEMYRKFARLDHDLYNFFNRSLWERIKKEGFDFQQEVSYFDNLNTRIVEFCKQEKVTKSYNTHFVTASKWSTEFNVTYEDCSLLFISESPFVSKIRQNQYPGMDESVGL